MIEVLIVTAILGLLVVTGIFYVYPNLALGRDGKRMSDLSKIKIAFEDYYNDNECYPPTDTLMKYCAGEVIDTLDPYMQSVPCDPRDRSAYYYTTIAGETNPSCPSKGYRILTDLERNRSEASLAINCGDAGGCGFGSNGIIYDYGIAEGAPVSIIDPDLEPDVPPDPELPPPPPIPGVEYWCCTIPGYSCASTSDQNATCVGRDFHGTGDISGTCESNCNP